jgi:hypothetical protein
MSSRSPIIPTALIIDIGSTYDVYIPSNDRIEFITIDALLCQMSTRMPQQLKSEMLAYLLSRAQDPSPIFNSHHLSYPPPPV